MCYMCTDKSWSAPLSKRQAWSTHCAPSQFCHWILCWWHTLYCWGHTGLGNLTRDLNIIGYTGWQRCIGCLKLQVFSRKRATHYMTLMQKEIGVDKTPMPLHHAVPWFPSPTLHYIVRSHRTRESTAWCQQYSVCHNFLVRGAYI